MTTTDTGVSLPTILAIALGTVKATDVVKRALWDAGIDKVPAQVKQLSAIGISVVIAQLVEEESSLRRRAFTLCASAGLASLLHSVERMARASGDADRMAALGGVVRRR